MVNQQPPSPAAASHAATAVRHPFPQRLRYAPGTLHPTGKGRTRADQERQVREFYNYWQKRYLTPSRHPGEWRVKHAPSPTADTVSEGQGYGMLLLALMAGHDADARTRFDGLWRYSRRHYSENQRNLMDWQVRHDEKRDASGNTSAFDGDCDIAYALLLADKQWGSDTGAISYGNQARRVLTALETAALGKNSHLPLLGDWVPPEEPRQERQDSDADRPRYTEYTVRSSDFMPEHFRAFHRFTGRPVWAVVQQRCQADVDLLQRYFSPRTGLLPDFIVRDRPQGRPSPPKGRFLETEEDPFYNYNACRVPWRLGTDAVLNADARSRAQTARISRWIEAAAKGDPANIQAGYRLDGTPLPERRYFSNAFIAPFGVAAMTVPSQQSWLNRIYDAVLSSSARADYYEDTLALLCLLVMTGNFWSPFPRRF